MKDGRSVKLSVLEKEKKDIDNVAITNYHSGLKTCLQNTSMSI